MTNTTTVKQSLELVKTALKNITVAEAADDPTIFDDLNEIRFLVEDFFKLIKPTKRPLNLR